MWVCDNDKVSLINVTLPMESLLSIAAVRNDGIFTKKDKQQDLMLLWAIATKERG